MHKPTVSDSVLRLADHCIRRAEALSELTTGGVFELSKEGKLTTAFGRCGRLP